MTNQKTVDTNSLIRLALRVFVAVLVLATTACGPITYTNWLKTQGPETVKCDVIKKKTTEAAFDKQCGDAWKMQESRGCRMYQRDDGNVLYYCFKDGVLDDILDSRGWINKQGE